MEKVVSFINYVQNEHGGKVIHTVDLSNSTYAHFLSANSAQSSSAGDQALKAAVYKLPSGTPCLGLSCRAFNNTPVIPITDKYVPKLPTQDTTSSQIQYQYIHGNDSITVPSTVTDSYNTDDNPEELSFFDALKNGEQLWGKLGNNYGEYYLISSFITLGHQHCPIVGECHIISVSANVCRNGSYYMLTYYYLK